MNDHKPIFVSLGLRQNPKEVVIFGISQDGREAAMVDANFRATQLWGGDTGRSIGVFEFSGPIGTTRQKILEWLAENDVLGAEASDLTRDIGQAMLDMMDGKTDRMIDSPPLR